MTNHSTVIMISHFASLRYFHQATWCWKSRQRAMYFSRQEDEAVALLGPQQMLTHVECREVGAGVGMRDMIMNILHVI